MAASMEFFIDMLGDGGVDAKIDVGGNSGTPLWWAARRVHDPSITSAGAYTRPLERFLWDRGCSQGLCSPS